VVSPGDSMGSSLGENACMHHLSECVYHLLSKKGKIMKSRKIALACVVLAVPGWAVAQVSLQVSVGVTVPPCSVALADASTMSIQMTAADVARQPTSALLSVDVLASELGSVVDVGRRDTNITVSCPIAQRVMMRFGDPLNDVLAGSHRAFVLKKGGGVGGDSVLGAYNIAINGQTLVDGQARDVVYRWASNFQDWRVPAQGVFLNGTYEYAFADAGSLTPLSISSATVPVSIRLGLSKARVAAAAVGGVIPPIVGAATVTVSSF
jgi:hypothetical protein